MAASIQGKEMLCEMTGVVSWEEKAVFILWEISDHSIFIPLGPCPGKLGMCSNDENDTPKLVWSESPVLQALAKFLLILHRPSRSSLIVAFTFAGEDLSLTTLVGARTKRDSD